jgi:hypothetical protein
MDFSMAGSGIIGLPGPTLSMVSAIVQKKKGAPAKPERLLRNDAGRYCVVM